ncbi:MAG TPA: CBS domain-containing protein [Nitrososphaerales archaeon]|nr:CBS domain-containing protein [Nitrososphaerales archaeon]
MSEVPLVRDYMTMRVISVDASDSVYNAADIMIKNDVGCVVITEYGDLVGILTKGDVLRGSLLQSKDPKTTKVGSIMTSSPVTIRASVTLEEAAKLMTEKEVSKLPVFDEGILAGVISSTDIIRVDTTYISFLRGLIERRVSHAR